MDFAEALVDDKGEDFFAATAKPVAMTIQRRTDVDA